MIIKDRIYCTSINSPPQLEEGNSLLIDLTAKANPPQIEYKWTNPDRLSVPEAADALPGTRDGNVVAVKFRCLNFDDTYALCAIVE